MMCEISDDKATKVCRLGFQDIMKSFVLLLDPCHFGRNKIIKTSGNPVLISGSFVSSDFSQPPPPPPPPKLTSPPQFFGLFVAVTSRGNVENDICMNIAIGPTVCWKTALIFKE